ncbi:MAG: hypothetical protein ACE14P_15355 [Methanotrichaceae archaeon]
MKRINSDRSKGLMMKSVELVIKGRKVIDAGYRPFLLLNAEKMLLMERCEV